MTYGGAGDGRDRDGRRCVLCGCRDHRVFGCARHAAGRCSCKSKGAGGR